MTERRWKFSQIISLSFVALILAAAFAGTFKPADSLMSDSVVQPMALAQENS